MVGFTDILVTYAICTVNLVKQNDKIFDSGNPNLKRLTIILVGFTFFLVRCYYYYGKVLLYLGWRLVPFVAIFDPFLQNVTSKMLGFTYILGYIYYLYS